MRVDSVLLSVEKCVNVSSNGNLCKSNEEIDEFHKELKVEVWLIDMSFDMRYIHDESVVKY